MMWRRCCGNDHQRGPVRGYRRVACGIRLYQPLRADTPVRITYSHNACGWRGTRVFRSREFSSVSKCDRGHDDPQRRT
jgi:hypothetical protein